MKGDRNTKFFHLTANGRHNRNLLNSISKDGICIEDPGRVKAEVLSYFEKAFKEDWSTRPKLGGMFPATLNLVQGDILIKDFSEEEIWLAWPLVMEIKPRVLTDLIFLLLNFAGNQLKGTWFSFFGNSTVMPKLLMGLISL